MVVGRLDTDTRKRCSQVSVNSGMTAVHGVDFLIIFSNPLRSSIGESSLLAGLPFIQQAPVHQAFLASYSFHFHINPGK